MKFSLVLATYNRKIEVELFIKSLLDQEYKLLELIVVDQNSNGLIDDIISNYSKDIDIKHYKSEKLGLSYNRNIGLKYISGDIIAFPDDDCEYPSNLLINVLNEFNIKSDVGIITGATVDKISGKSYLLSPNKPSNVNYRNIFSTAISFTIFVNLNKCENRKFDTLLGVGSTFGSSEETDFLIGHLIQNQKIFYQPSIFVYHPISNSNESLERAYNYALGFGALHRKHFYRSHYFYFFRFLAHLLINSLRVIFGVNILKNWSILRGKILGFILYKEKIA